MASPAPKKWGPNHVSLLVSSKSYTIHTWGTPPYVKKLFNGFALIPRGVWAEVGGSGPLFPSVAMPLMRLSSCLKADQSLPPIFRCSRLFTTWWKDNVGKVSVNTLKLTSQTRLGDDDDQDAWPRFNRLISRLADLRLRNTHTYMICLLLFFFSDVKSHWGGMSAGTSDGRLPYI